jgi:hypothetical protein
MLAMACIWRRVHAGCAGYRQKFFRLLFKSFCTALRTKMVGLPGVGDFAGGPLRVNHHSADGILHARRGSGNGQTSILWIKHGKLFGHYTILDVQRCWMIQIGARLHERNPCAGWYNPGMTLVEITYELQSPLTQDQLRRLGEFSNTYGLRRFNFDEGKKHLSFEYDASRLRETQIEHVLGQATIAVARKVTETGAQTEFKN